MLPLFPEYRYDHPRFREHARVAFIMAMIAPVCAVFFFRAIGWWNPWLWASCGVGLSLGVCLYSVMALHGKPGGISAFSRRQVARSPEWFPYFFVIVQSSIASLIVMFLWFSTTSLVLDVPLYVHVILVALALMIPARRFFAAHQAPGATVRYDRGQEILRGAWHLLMTVFLARSIIGLTITDLRDTSPENIAWQIMVWVPAIVYMLFVVVLVIDHLRRMRPVPDGAPPAKLNRETMMDRL